MLIWQGSIGWCWWRCEYFAIVGREQFLGLEGCLRYRLLALDLDGTTVGADLVVAPQVIAMVGAAQACGVHVILATGRMFGATLPFAAQLQVRDPLICYQGALIRHPHTLVTYAHVGMPPLLASEAVALLLTAGVFVIAYVDERLCVAANRPELDAYLRWHPDDTEVVVVSDLPAFVAAHPPTKLVFIAESLVVAREVARLGQHFAGRLAVVRSHERLGELTALGVDKGRALAQVAGYLGIERSAVVAIGDHENDMPMIAWAGLGLAMGNAIAEVQRIAAAVVPSVEEAGVAWAIERYVLR